MLFRDATAGIPWSYPLAIVTKPSKQPKRSLRFTAACVQFDVRRGAAAENLAKAEAGLATAAAAGAQLAVLPEMWPTSFLAEVDADALQSSRAAEARMLQLSGDLNLVVVGSGYDGEPSRLYNRALVVDRGRLAGAYRKIHLFSPHGEHRMFAAGQQPLVVDTSVGRLGTLICYDLRFPELVRWYFYKEVEVLVVPAQWPEARAGHWRTLLQARAIENEMFVVGCNRTGLETSLKTGDNLVFPGDSRIVDPMGEVIAVGAGEETPVVAEIELRKVHTMRRILPVLKDRRPAVYRDLWQDTWR